MIRQQSRIQKIIKIGWKLNFSQKFSQKWCCWWCGSPLSGCGGRKWGKTPLHVFVHSHHTPTYSIVRAPELGTDHLRASPPGRMGLTRELPDLMPGQRAISAGWNCAQLSNYPAPFRRSSRRKRLWRERTASSSDSPPDKSPKRRWVQISSLTIPLISKCIQIQWQDFLSNQSTQESQIGIRLGWNLNPAGLIRDIMCMLRRKIKPCLNFRPMYIVNASIIPHFSDEGELN